MTNIKLTTLGGVRENGKTCTSQKLTIQSLF